MIIKKGEMQDPPAGCLKRTAVGQSGKIFFAISR
jgi:hypothetical protein